MPLRLKATHVKGTDSRVIQVCHKRREAMDQVRLAYHAPTFVDSVDSETNLTKKKKKFK